MSFDSHMPSGEELRELAIKIFYEENPEATTNPEDYELKAPEGHYYLLARSRAMSGIKEELYKALSGLEEETENILNSLKELGEVMPKGYTTDEELLKRLTNANDKLARTERKLEKANQTIDEMTSEKVRFDELLRKQEERRPQPTPEPPVQPEPPIKKETIEPKPQKQKEKREIVERPLIEKRGKMTEKPKGKRAIHVRTSDSPKSENLAQLSGVITTKAIDILLEMIKSGASNLMQGYASVIIVSDLMHSAGLLTDNANNAISALSTIITAISTAEGVIGIFTGANNAFQPQLKTKVEQTINESGQTTEKSTTEASGRAAQQLAGLIPELAGA